MNLAWLVSVATWPPATILKKKLLVPLAMTMAVKAGADPRLTALVVALSASNTFILPTHQVNALVMRPGGYKTIDYTKAGAGMTILFLVVMLTMLYLFY